MALKPNLQTFPGLSHQAFQHPLDSQALAALSKIPLMPQLTRSISEGFAERYVRVRYISGSLRLGMRQYGSLYREYIRMARALDLRQLPQLFLITDPVPNAFATGCKAHFIVVHSGMLDLLSENELLAVLGHELGHVKCDHMLYTTMVQLLSTLGSAVVDLCLPGVGAVAANSIQLPLLEWYRKAEFSCDRAALLATQDLDAVCGGLAKVAGFSKHLAGEINIQEVVRQANDYEELGADSLVEKAIKLAVLLQQTHPYPVIRVREIMAWANSEEYTGILRGQYLGSGQG